MKYAEIASINVNEHVEKKNNLSYLSWAWAVDQLLRLDETATWEYREPVKFNDTVMVFCTVTAFGRARTAQLPVMNYKNQAIPNPDAFQMNTAMQRCLAKAIALHGLGLYIYAGEDLPEGEEAEKSGKVQLPKAGPEAHSPAKLAWEMLDGETQDYLRSVAMDVKTLCLKSDIKGAVERIEIEDLDADSKAGLWSLLDSKERSAIKAAAKVAA